MVRSAYSWLFGFDVLANDNEEMDRWRCCLNCPHRKPIPGVSDMGQCQICSCLIEFKVKLASEKCPIGKWKRIWRRRVKKDTV